MGNVYSEDNWMVHFRDTMRGGKPFNHWRMAELHAKEAPARVWELDATGRRIHGGGNTIWPAASLVHHDEPHEP